MSIEEKIETLQSIMIGACTLCDDYFRPDPDCDEHCIRLNTINEASAALRKAEKYKWHDLRKDPSDLPVKQGIVLAWVLPPTKQYLFRSLKLVYFTDLMGICKSCHFHNGMVGESDFENYDERVIAWKEIDPFEVEK